MISKTDARVYGKTMRKSITTLEREEKEKLILNNFFSLEEINFASNVCVYFAIGSEVNINEIITRLLNLGKNIFAPVTRGEDMFAVKYESGEKLSQGAFNIPEPQGEYFDADKLDLVIVPLVAFNSNKARIGYGKGYYDRFLPENAVSVGIAFSEQECDFLPEKHDKQLDIIVTDKGVLR